MFKFALAAAISMTLMLEPAVAEHIEHTEQGGNEGAVRCDNEAGQAVHTHGPCYTAALADHGRGRAALLPPTPEERVRGGPVPLAQGHGRQSRVRP